MQRDTKSFHAALRASLREDPDIILIGELRDLETIRLALTAAETGHLVFATLIPLLPLKQSIVLLMFFLVMRKRWFA